MKKKTALKEGEVKTCHFTIEGAWFTWFLRHLWFEGSHFKAIKTWRAAFPDLSTPEHLNTTFLEIVNGKMKFTGTSDGPNGFGHKKDGTKFWNPTQGKPDKHYPLLQSWEDVMLLKKAKLYIEELRLRDYRLNREFPHTLEENEYNVIRWNRAALENEVENGYRKRCSALWTEVREIGSFVGLQPSYDDFPQDAAVLNTLRCTGSDPHGPRGRKIEGNTGEIEGEKIYNHVMGILNETRQYFKKKYGQEMLDINEEEIREICGLRQVEYRTEPTRPAPITEAPEEGDSDDEVLDKMARQAQIDMAKENMLGTANALARSIIPGMNLDPLKYIENLQKDQGREEIVAEDVYKTTWQSGYIDPHGNFYGCADISHHEFSKRLCDKFGFFDKPKAKSPSWLKAKRGDPAPQRDGEIELDERGWVRISVNRFYWDANKKITDAQKDTIRWYMEAKKLTKAIFNSMEVKTFEEGTKYDE